MSNPTEATKEGDLSIFSNPTYKRHLDNFAQVPHYSITVNHKVAKQFLHAEWLFCNGNIRGFKVTHLGLGVYKVSTIAKTF